MSDETPTAETPKADIDVTNAWQASQDQKGKAKKLRLMAAGSWVVAIGTEIAAIVLVSSIRTWTRRPKKWPGVSARCWL